MIRPRRTPRHRKRIVILLSVGVALAAMIVAASLLFLWRRDAPSRVLVTATTLAGFNREFGEPFGVAVKGDDVFVSDGEAGKIWKISAEGVVTLFAEGLNTPSAIAFYDSGDLFVADTGSHTIKKIDESGRVELLAGAEGEAGNTDGDINTARFNAPIGIAVGPDGKIYVADTYNDRIRVIENSLVTTLAGGTRGFSDSVGSDAKFDTPCGIAVLKDGRILVADTGNGRIRIVEPDGRVTTLAGDGSGDVRDGLLAGASFYRPSALAIDEVDNIYVADGNAIRAIRRRAFPFVETLSDERSGFADGTIFTARFNRPSGLAIDKYGDLIIADSDNRVIRAFSSNPKSRRIEPGEVNALRGTAAELRDSQEARWPYDPPQNRREIAGTLGEIRGEINGSDDPVWFHNGLDIAGGYGETARFMRSEHVLRPFAAENFGDLRELLRMPLFGYIHIRLGRDSTDKPFGDERFMFEFDAAGKPLNLRVRRGTKFNAGEPVGTLNRMNHVHLITGRSGAELNALDAVAFPNISDSKQPVIEKLTLFDENWQEIETARPNERIKLAGNTRIVVRAYDQMDGNAERRRLSVHKIGYQILNSDGTQRSDQKWTIDFGRMPSHEAVRFAYAKGSKSGATGETIFNYIATNEVNGDIFREGLFDAALLEPGFYILRVFAADYFGNTASKDINFEVIK